MISSSPVTGSLSRRSPTKKAKKLFVGVPAEANEIGRKTNDTPEEASMSKHDALRHIPVGTPARSMPANQLGRTVPVVDVDPEMQHRVLRMTGKFSESLVIFGNEPSLGLYRLQEHVRRSLPILVDHKRELEQINQQVQGVCFDSDYAGSVVQGMHKITQFSNVQSLLDRAIKLKQNLNQIALEQELGVSQRQGALPAGSSPRLKPASTAAATITTASSAVQAQQSPLAAGATAAQASPGVSGTPPAKLLPGLSTQGALKAMQQKKQSDDDFKPKTF